MSHTTKQVNNVLKDIITQVCYKNKKNVSWHPQGITNAYSFEIEPWRNLSRKPVSLIKEHSPFTSSPFRLPDKINKIKPYFDYTTYKDPNKISYNLRNREVLECKPMYPIVSVHCKLSDDNESSDNKFSDNESSDNTIPRLERTHPISLDEVYKIAQELNRIKDYDKFINDSE